MSNTRELIELLRAVSSEVEALAEGPSTWHEIPRMAADALQSLADENERLRAALTRIFDMSERPVCKCGIKTGTAAIKSCAKSALENRHE